MGLIIDTHVFLWAAGVEGRLSKKAKELLQDPDEPIFFSAASSWEIAIKWAKGALALPENPLAFVTETISSAGYAQLAVSIRDTCAAADLPLLHKDPFDRLLIAQSKKNGLRLFSNDPIFKKYDVDVFWL